MDNPFLNDKTQAVDGSYDCEALLRIVKPITDNLYQTLYQDAKFLPFEHSQTNIYLHRVFPMSVNHLYMQSLFLNDCYLRDPLRMFSDNYNRRRLISTSAEVRERKQRVQQ